MSGTDRLAALQVLNFHSININGITSSVRVRMFHHFFRRSETDMFIQEITSMDVL